MIRHLIFILSFAAFIAGSMPASAQNNGRYEEAGIENDRQFEKWYKQFKAYVKAENRQKVAELMSYPLEIRINKQGKKLKSKREFLLIYKDLFTEEVKEIIADSKVRELTVTDKGVMVGKGEVWINVFEGKPGFWITAINN